MEQYPEPLSTEIDTIDKNQFKFFSTKNGDPKGTVKRVKRSRLFFHHFMY